MAHRPEADRRSSGRHDEIVTVKAILDFRAMAAEPGNPLGAEVARFGSTTATRLESLSGLTPYNKARGFDRSDLEHVPAIEAFFSEAGIPIGVEVSSEAQPGVTRALERRGYTEAAAVAATLHLDLTSRPRSAEHRTAPITSGAALEPGYLSALLDGYGFSGESPELVHVMAFEHRTPGLVRYTVGEDPVVAAAALFVWRRTAYLAGAATVPEARGRGHQRALIARRLADAVELGCSRAVATAAADSPSVRNLERAGFAVVSTRVTWLGPDAGCGT